MTGPSGLAAVAAELYALPPGDFTAARNARAKQAKADGDRELAAQVQALRRPTVAAWAANALVRRQPDAVEQLLALGTELRAAQAAMAGQQLRELVRRQHDLMADLRHRADALAAESGQTLTDAVAVQVEGTLRAAMTDPDAEAAVRSGLLTAELQSTGFGPVVVGDALAVPGAPPLLAPGRPVATAAAAPPTATPPAPAPPRTAPPAGRRRVTVSDEAPATRRTVRPQPGAGQDDERLVERERRDEREREEAARRQKEARQEAARRARREAAEQDVALAESAAADADAALGAAQDAVGELTRRHAELSAEIEQLTARLHRLEAERTATGRDERRAHAARESAARAAETARRRARTARRRLDELG